MISLKMMTIANSRKFLIYFCLFQDQSKLGTPFKGINFPGFSQPIPLVTPCSIRSDSATLDVTWRGITTMARLIIWKASTHLFISLFILAWQKFISNLKSLHKNIHIRLTFKYPCLNSIKSFCKRGNKIYLFESVKKKEKMF